MNSWNYITLKTASDMLSFDTLIMDVICLSLPEFMMQNIHGNINSAPAGKLWKIYMKSKHQLDHF